jgi:guanylate kinase
MSMMSNTGKIFVISAPSGAGKTSLCKELIDFFPELRHSVSFTTRPIRVGEVDGEDYHFVDQGSFDQMIASGAFAEWALVHGNSYGTSLRTLQQAIDSGSDILLEIDCQGAQQLKKRLDNAVFIFIMPPSLDELRRRLIGRDTDSDAVIEQRINNASDEINEATWYDHVVINDKFELALNQLQSIFQGEQP